jgi:methanogenic corrinoid protein MtbC1
MMGERTPFDEPSFSHGVCARCEASLERDEPLHLDTESVRALFGRIVASARLSDETACAGLLVEARALGLDAESLLVGMLQPALYQAGLDWHEGQISPAAERRFTSWCERVFAMVAPAVPSAPAGPPINLLIFHTPGNAHTVGPRFAAHVLSARGLSVELVASALPLDEMVGLAQRLRPRFIGFSCALPSDVSVATDLVDRLRAQLEPVITCRYVLSGFAFRRGGASPPVAPGVEVALDLDYFGATDRAPPAPSRPAPPA